MPSYELTRTADGDLTGLYIYTYFELGENQADAYFQSLEESLGRLAENPQLGADAASVLDGYRRYLHEHHCIYYKRTRAGIRVIRILGPGLASAPNPP